MFSALAVTLVFAGAIPEPTAGIARLYATTATQWLDSVEADPSLTAPGGRLDGVGLTVLVHDQATVDPAGDGRIDACVVVERARSLGVWAMPGIRAYHSKSVDTLVTAAWWDERADVLERILRCADIGDETRITVDVEDYSGNSILDIGALGVRGLTPETLRGRMSRFLRFLSLRGMRVGVYPVAVIDEAHKAIAGAVERLEVWGEGSFDLTEDVNEASDSYAQSFVGLARHSTPIRVLFPTAQFRYGLRDSFLRRQGRQMRSRTADLGPLPPWVFRYWRRSDETGIGGASWLDGTDRDSRNDIDNAWRWDARIRPLAGPTPTLSQELKKYNANGAINNTQIFLGSDGWLEIPNGQTYQIRPVPYIGNGPFTIVLTWRLNSDFLPFGERYVWGAARVDTGSGDGRAWWVQVRTEANGSRTVELCGCVPKTLCTPLHTDVLIGQPFRQAIVWDGTALVAHSVDGDDERAVASVGTSWVAYPSIRIGQPRMGDPGTIAVFDDFIIARRAWTSDELATLAVGGERYPYSFPEGG